MTTEEALYQFMKRIRLERSALRLKMEKDASITKIGEAFGYSSSNFSTAFKKHLSLSPADFRKNCEDIAENSAFFHGESMDNAEENEGMISVEWLDELWVVYERRKGNYYNLDYEWCDFMKRYKFKTRVS